MPARSLFQTRSTVLVLTLLLCVGTFASCKKPEPLPKLALVPNFELTNQDAKRFRGADLDGKVWVAGFFFTSCPSICPALTERMRSIQKQTAQLKNTHYVFFSVDPRVDTPAVLNDYAKRYGADTKTWHFATGNIDAIKKTVVKGFKLRMGEREERAKGRYDIMHASHFALVDKKRQIRGYYRSDDQGTAKLIKDIRQLHK